MIRDWSNFIGGRSAIVTGAGAGVGRAIAIQMARAGATVWVNDLYADRAEKVVGEIEAEGLSARPVVGDVTEIESVHEMRDTTGPVDIVVNNAGSGVRFFGEGKARLVSFVESKPDEWDPIRAHALTQAVASFDRQDQGVALSGQDLGVDRRTDLILARADAFVEWLKKPADRDLSPRQAVR